MFKIIGIVAVSALSIYLLVLLVITIWGRFKSKDLHVTRDTCFYIESFSIYIIPTISVDADYKAVEVTFKFLWFSYFVYYKIEDYNDK